MDDDDSFAWPADEQEAQADTNAEAEPTAPSAIVVVVLAIPFRLRSSVFLTEEEGGIGAVGLIAR